MAFPEAWLTVAIEAAAGCRAFPAFVPREAPLPFVAFSRSSTIRERYLEDNAACPLASFGVVVFAAKYAHAKELANRVRIGVDNFSGVGEGVNITSCHLTDEVDGEPSFESGSDTPSAYSVEMTFDIRYTEEP
jgi:hypothetical protein